MRPSLALLLFAAACAGDTKVGVYNTPPSASILSPPDGTTFDEGDTVTLEGLVDDDFTDPPAMTVVWSSDRDGELMGDAVPDADGLTSSVTSSLTAGNHTITLRVTDEDGESAKDSVSIVISDVPDAPEISVVHPASGESGVEGEEFEFVVQVSDQQDESQTLSVVFDSDQDGEFCTPIPDTVGVASCEFALSAGDHLIDFTVTDSSGLSSTETVAFAVTSTEQLDDDGDGWTEVMGDCNDADSSVNPSATEYYNGRDDDCDGLIDDGTTGYDDDGDGYTELDDDCDDDDPNVFPGASEAYNATDDDCDGTVDEGTEGYDDDGDGYTEIAGDCDDTTALSYPSGTEIADGEDNDCDGTTDEGTTNYDDDGDGYSEAAGDCDDTTASSKPGGTESCGDGKDNDCDGSADEANASGCTTYYYDYDADGYGSSSVAGSCQCSSSGYYTSSTNTDCYDYNASANPAATTYYSSQRGDGKYDYNCDSSESKYYTASYSCDTDWTGFSCDSYTNGFKSSVPSCGSSGTWYTGCDAEWFDCDPTSSSTVTQSCR